MISLHSSGSPAETTMVSTLLEIIKDPAAAEKRLNELKAEKLAAIDAAHQARAAADEAKAEHKAATAKLLEVRQLQGTVNSERATHIKQASDHDALLASRRAQLDTHAADVAKRESGLAAREDEVKAREDDVAAREAAVEKLEADAKALMSEYAEKMETIAAFNAALNGPK